MTAYRLPTECRNPGWLRRQYWENQLSYTELAELCDCSAGGIQYQMKKLGIPRRKQRDANANHVALTNQLQQFLEGQLLGDGNLFSVHSTSASFQLSDSSKRYVLWVSKKLAGFGLKTDVAFNRANGAFHCRTKHYREFQNLYDLWYPNGKKRVPSSLVLTPNVTKFWYIGDGTYSGTPPIIRIAVINERLRESLPFLQSQLLNRKIGCTIQKYGLYVLKKFHQAFFDFILSEESEIPPDYEYKFRKVI